MAQSVAAKAQLAVARRGGSADVGAGALPVLGGHMAEHQDPIESEAERAKAGGAALAAGVAAALGGGGALAPEAAAFLTAQRRLAEAQLEDLEEDRALQHKHLRLRFFGDRLRIGLQMLAIGFGLALAIGVAAMAWQAHQDHGLVIDAFSTPPDLARNGLTGDVAAARFLDKLQALQTASANSDRPEQSFQDNWGADLKVEIPETGLTFGEFEKLLRDRLGKVRHVSGEVLKTPSGIALTARLGDAPPQTFTGAEGDFDALAQKAAEAVYRASQPYRFAEYLDGAGRVDEAIAVVADLAANGPRSERGWAFSKWAMMDLTDRGDPRTATLHANQGLGFGAGSDLSDRISLVNTAVWSGHDQANLELSRILDVEAQKRLPDTSRVFYVENRLLAAAWLQFSEPDYRASAAGWTRVASEGFTPHFAGIAPAMAATAYILDHDPGAARQALALRPPRDDPSLMWDAATGAFTALPAYCAAVEAGNWPAALADARAVDAALDAGMGQHPIFGAMKRVWIRPLEALALARTGDVAAAQALIGDAPLDCDLCLRVRGQIAALAGDRAGADRWFAEAVRQAPSLPFAYAEWAAALLARGDADGAIARLALARRAAPRFADPSELWGEALMRKGDAEGAAARFAEADRDAPRWGRNHLLWGQALARLGRVEEAKAQWRTASGLGLTAADQATLRGLLKTG